MKQLPAELLHSLEGIAGFNRSSFEAVHQAGDAVTSIRINERKFSVEEVSFDIESKVPWAASGYYLRRRPSFTFDPFFHAGCYYVQEASSMFLEQALVQLEDNTRPTKVLDLCAAPGGKSTHLQSLLHPESLLVSNEVIRNRNLVLTDNIIKWGSSNVFITHQDPAAFQKLGAYFDVIVVDAPCSGSGLFRKDEAAIEEWSPGNVALCCQRQQRILADILPALKENGMLVYSTCSYSKEEDEDIGRWLVKEMQMQAVPLQTEPSWNIVTSFFADAEAYRFYPDHLKGEGFFISCFRKTASSKPERLRPSKLEKLPAKEKGILQTWIKGDWEMIRDRNRIFLLPPSLFGEYSLLSSVLNITYKGVEAGEIMKEKLVPHHALALNDALSESVAFQDVDYDNAIRYLQRKELNFNSSGKGWQLVRYKGHNLGWINVLANRINNYYPKEIRILKQSNDASFEK